MFATTNNRGEAHQCLPFFKALQTCAQSSMFPKKQCTNYADDYLECRHGTKKVFIRGNLETF